MINAIKKNQSIAKNTSPHRKKLDNAIEDIVIEKHGYNFEFNELDQDQKIKILFLAMNDIRFDLSELLYEAEVNMIDIIGELSRNKISLDELGLVIIYNLLNKIEPEIQELIDNTTQEFNENLKLEVEIDREPNHHLSSHIRRTVDQIFNIQEL